MEKYQAELSVSSGNLTINLFYLKMSISSETDWYLHTTTWCVASVFITGVPNLNGALISLTLFWSSMLDPVAEWQGGKAFRVLLQMGFKC